MRAWLGDRGIVQSMSAAGYCYDNAACESFFATLVPWQPFDTRQKRRLKNKVLRRRPNDATLCSLP